MSISVDTLLEVLGHTNSFYSLKDRGDGSAAVELLVVVDDINETGIQSLLDAHGGTIPGAQMISDSPELVDAGPPAVWGPHHRILIWAPPDDGEAGPLQQAAVGFLVQGEGTQPKPRWILSTKERQLLGLAGSGS